MSKEVWIIGVDPPCPRCDLTRQRVERISKAMCVPLDIRHMIYSDLKAQAFAKSVGKETGTAKHVAVKAGINMDWDHVHAVVKNPPSRPEDFDKIVGIARQWSPEMDEAIRPCQEKADSVGILMTPILVVDRHVKHHGSVPSLAQLQVWLT
ncbi:MAG: thioredoxin family protein [Desulfobacterium sp.]|nr:thioredoxin family protein [Desulfobacterium sp.]MBU3947247.1 thioredoxin family protein [Pseudomonadota bacterium]MBU4009425.1 thioredoxin family protein [Pseudomonadota bacterium]MBU4036507.1 thioredoxin family protein [Pseudomonadota bacterium]